MADSSKPIRTVLVPLCAFAALAPSVAQAHERDYVWTYEWYVPYKGEWELEFWATDFGGGRTDFQVELERGVDGRYAVAPYLLVSRDGNDFRVDGWKLEQRYAFGDFRYGRLLPALYAEVKKHGDEEYEMEFEAIGTVALANGWNWSGNLIAEGEAKGGSAVEWGYATAIGRPLDYSTSLGIEAFGSFTEKEHFIGPTAGFKLANRQKLVAGYGFATDGGPGRMRLLFEVEF